MVSPELIRRYSFFAGLDQDEVLMLARVANEMTVDAGYWFFHEGEEISHFYIMLEGSAVIIIEAVGLDKDVVIGTAGPGDVFGWSGLIPPYTATASVQATTTCRVVAFESQALREAAEQNCHFGYTMMMKIAQIMRDRLRATRVRCLTTTDA
ncbi:MAG: cyclic nucleotide-binding domain-containing protein [Anaerolineae bacterium]|nr:cyclic nucleotide-binding domain-containing protein [Anaerolineae bacterium]